VILCALLEAPITGSKLFHFLSELKRRKVFQVVAGYAVVAWIIIQLASMNASTIDTSGHVLLWIEAIAVAGLPVAAALSWIYDITPLGLRFTQALRDDAPEQVVDSRGLHGDSAVAAVAVLPFENLTPNTPHAYLADAIPIELQSLLSRMHDLRVVSRQSAVARSAARTDLPTIARNLTVQYVISGSVADLGERLQINIQLDDAVDDTLLWSERYDVVAKDMERLQHEITEKVVATFGGERMRVEIRRANEAASADSTAWQLVQKARSYLLDYTPASVAASIPLLRRAIELDPRYAVAYAMLGHLIAEKTLNAISTDLAADRRQAIDTIARAEQIAPRDPVVLRAAGCVHAYTGSYRRSLELLRRAVKLAPYDLGTWGYLGWPLVATGQAEDLRELHEIVDRLLATSAQHPGRVYWLFHKSVAYGCAGECERAIAPAEEYTIEQPRFSLGWMHYANVLGRLGRKDAARSALEQCLGHNPLMRPAYYIELMRVLSDQPAVVESRTAGLFAAGLVEAPRSA
jgi:TolB-like protein